MDVERKIDLMEKLAVAAFVMTMVSMIGGLVCGIVSYITGNPVLVPFGFGLGMAAVAFYITFGFLVEWIDKRR